MEEKCLQQSRKKQLGEGNKGIRRRNRLQTLKGPNGDERGGQSEGIFHDFKQWVWTQEACMKSRDDDSNDR